jgi:hypothetical protein
LSESLSFIWGKQCSLGQNQCIWLRLDRKIDFHSVGKVTNDGGLGVTRLWKERYKIATRHLSSVMSSWNCYYLLTITMPEALWKLYLIEDAHRTSKTWNNTLIAHQLIYVYGSKLSGCARKRMEPVVVATLRTPTKRIILISQTAMLTSHNSQGTNTCHLTSISVSRRLGLRRLQHTFLTQTQRSLCRASHFDNGGCVRWETPCDCIESSWR